MDGGHEDWRSHDLQLQDWQWRRSQRERCREGNHRRRRLREGVVCNLAWGSAEPGDQGGVTWRPMWLVNPRGGGSETFQEAVMNSTTRFVRAASWRRLAFVPLLAAAPVALADPALEGDQRCPAATSEQAR